MWPRGRGKQSRQTPEELRKVADMRGLDGEALVRISRITARMDNNCIADGFQIYLHSFIVAASGEWAVIPQGMNAVAAASIGITNLKTDPSASPESTQMQPPYRSTMRDIGWPKPVMTVGVESPEFHKSHFVCASQLLWPGSASGKSAVSFRRYAELIFFPASGNALIVPITERCSRRPSGFSFICPPVHCRIA